MLSWGPPHDPYHTAPEEFKELYQGVDIKIPENVPEEHKEKACNQLHGYYSHISALDQCLKMIMKCLKRNQLERNTLVVLTSDHGDMLFSQGLTRKLYPFEESVRVPFVIRDPDLKHQAGKHVTHRLMHRISCQHYLGLPILSKVIIQKDAIGLR